MLFLSYVKNDFMSVKKTSSFKTHRLAAKCILLGGLRYARVTMSLLLVMKCVTVSLFALDYVRMFVTVRQQETTRW